MSAKEHDNEHDHGHEHEHGHDHAHEYEGPPRPALPPTPEHGYWKSMRELEGKAPWQVDPTNKEFPPGADQPPQLDPMSRRNFFHLMGAGMGLAGIGVGASACRYDKEEIVPLSHRPENDTPGNTLQYATTYDLGGSAHALIATSYEGRPIHLDGNPEHPFAGGPILEATKRHAGAHTFAQASILHLYDPDRSQNPLSKGHGASMDEVKSAVAEIRKSFGAGGVHILSEATSSPTVQALRAKLEQQGVAWHEYEPLSWDNERAGTRVAFGRPVRPIAKLDQCETILTIDCDLFVEHPASMRYSRDFAKSRRRGGSLGAGKMNRLWSVESIFSNTGAMADHRLPLRSELALPFVQALDAALAGGAAPAAAFLQESKNAKFLKVLAQELKANSGRAVVIAGRRQPPEVHALVAKINDALGAPGKTLDYVEDPEPTRPTHLEAITQLAKAMQGGQVKALVLLGGNPVYDAPADLDFKSALGKVPTTLHLSEYADETSKVCTWHVPKAHFLEAWGDARTWDGTISLAQPLIAPLWGGLSSAELLSLLLGDEKGGEALVKETHATLGLNNWRKNVHDGFVPNTQLPVAQVTLASLPPFQLTPNQLTGSKRGNGQLEVTFHYSTFTYDGRFSNNAWLWETPDFLTKVTWDNYAMVSPETATELNLENNTMITVKVGDRSIELPCYTMPGQARYSIALVLGGGRTEAGHVTTHPHNVSDKPPGNRVVGYDTYKVRTTTGFGFATNASATGGGSHYVLASVVDHWDYRGGIVDFGAHEDLVARSHDLVREVTADKLAKDKNYKAVGESDFWDEDQPQPDGHARHLSLFEEKVYTGHRWAMSIDLSSCTGCNSCMVACQSENNVPVVGRREVINNREMHWIRIDRYFQGPPDDPHVVYEPLPCQQCENAPCEQVCPVGATQHSEEGLNDMVYNRCIGTRYCLNNCPYKVRRFNFLDWNSEFRTAREKVRRLLFNPDVTVRMRGVMEKCTYCVQRIQNGKIAWKAQHRNPTPEDIITGDVTSPLPDGNIETSCQMA
jgi:molybdopterin-containing oxidoreductase family iron-sulfur binding subunit